MPQQRTIAEKVACRAFVDVAIQRWQKATGHDAILDDDGRTFAEIAAERVAT